MQTRTWLWFFGLCCWALASGVAAQEDGAREHFRRGEAAYQKGNYELAISEWQAAYGQDPRPRIQFNIYQAHERLGQLPQAVEALQTYLSSADPDDPYYADATARMAALQQRLQATGIRLLGGLDGATIEISGHNWGRLPRPDKVPVQPGNHRVVIRLGGYEDFVANVVVPAGQVVDVTVQLEPGESSEAAAAAASHGSTNAGGSGGASTVDSAGGDGTPFYVAAAALGAGAIGAGVWALNRSSELDGCDDPDFFCAEQSTVETQRNLAFGLTGALAAGAIGVLIYGIVVDGDSGEQNAAACIPTGLGAHCQVRF